MTRAKIRTEKSPAGTIRLAEALETPMATYLAAEALAKTVFPREPGQDAVQRLCGLSHQQAIYLAQDAAPYRETVDATFYLAQERALGLEEE